MDESKNLQQKDQSDESCCDHSHDFLSGIFFGFIVIWLGVVLYLENRGIFDWHESWVWYFLFGLGVIFLIEVVVRALLPEFRTGVSGKLIAAVVLMLLGAWKITGLGDWWPVLLIIAGVVIILHGIKQHSQRTS